MNKRKIPISEVIAMVECGDLYNRWGKEVEDIVIDALKQQLDKKPEMKYDYMGDNGAMD